MIIACPKETHINENRVAIVPSSVKEYLKSGLDISIESDAGINSYFTNKEYLDNGAKIISDKRELLNKADIIVKVNPPTAEEAQLLRNESTFVSLFQTLKEKEIIDIFIQKKLLLFQCI